MSPLLLLSIVYFAAEVHSQTFPYVSFRGQTLTNHSYVDLSLVGDDGSGSDSVQYHTDLSTCCSGAQGIHRGDWYFPSGTTRLPFTGGGDIFERRESQRVDLRRRNNPTSPTGLYRCDIPTIAVHDDTDPSVRETVYVGLYTASGGDITIPGGMTYDPNQRTLTCISTGGPATTVTWTRDSTTVTEGTETVLDDPVTANYTHTLTLPGFISGNFRCTVANNKPSSASATFIIGGGAKGEKGEQGPKGDQGDRGGPGVPGPTGDQGEQGPSGKTGLPGATGEAGETGMKGDVGAPGVQGEEGRIGNPGVPGDSGDQGPRGEKGEFGEIGLQGDEGSKGDVGEQGQRGLRGDIGPNGEMGERGVDGEPGTTGEPGLQGEVGEPGPGGPIGPEGTTGVKGDMGEKGEEGVEGPQGPQGEQGEIGFLGPPGPRGVDGSRGERGEQGLDGVPGVSGEDGAKGQKGDGGGGAIYVRWGKITCPNTEGTEIVYNGTAAGSHHYHGGGGNYQCLTNRPANFAFGPGREDAGYIYGTEFETWGNVPPTSLPLANRNVACSVCYIATRGAVVMIPGTYICPIGWTTEYYGYLMSERYKNRRSTFECVDVSPDILPRPEQDVDREGDDTGALFYHVEPRCGSLPCPPYEEQKEVTCVVCTR